MKQTRHWPSRQFTSRTWQAARQILMCGGFGFTVAALVSLAVGYPPAPSIHDEFAQVLGADTFARGRLTNPTHPFWEHFETFHVIQQPSYSSKYPPAPAAVMALGQVVFGQPIVGVWLAYALMCAAFTWMLFAWIRPRWAFWGGLLGALWFAGIHANAGYWTHTYWGGSVAAAGGALVLGGIARLTRGGGAPLGAAFALGLGLVVLATSRPFEGVLAAIPVAVALGVWLATLARSPRDRRRVVGPTVAIAACLAAGAATIGTHNVAVTGRATVMPYMEYERQYASSPLVFAGTAGRPSWRHEVMRCFYTVGRGRSPAERWPSLDLSRFSERSAPLAGGYAPLFAAPLLLVLPAILRRRKFWLPAAMVASAGVSLVLTPWNLFMHYAAPAAGAWLVLIVAAFRHLGALRVVGRRVGLFLQHALFLVVAGSAVTTALAFVVTRPQVRTRWDHQRQIIRDSLARSPRRHLVLVEYGPKHAGDHEWVYNDAAIDESPVVWARSMGASRDEKLLAYFDGRVPVRLRVDDDAGPFTLVPVDRAALRAAAQGEVPPTATGCSSDSAVTTR